MGEARQDPSAVGQPGQRVVGGPVSEAGGLVARPRDVVGDQTDEAAALGAVIAARGHGGTQHERLAEGVDVIDVTLPRAVGFAGNQLPRCVVEQRAQHGACRTARRQRIVGLRAQEMERRAVRRLDRAVEAHDDDGGPVGVEEGSLGEVHDVVHGRRPRMRARHLPLLIFVVAYRHRPLLICFVAPMSWPRTRRSALVEPGHVGRRDRDRSDGGQELGCDISIGKFELLVERVCRDSVEMGPVAGRRTRSAVADIAEEVEALRVLQRGRRPRPTRPRPGRVRRSPSARTAGRRSPQSRRP